MTRYEEIAIFMLETRGTVRTAAKKYNISKSTAHVHVTKYLEKVNYSLYLEIRKLLDYNASQKAVRGGEATRSKYRSLQSLDS